MMAVFKRGKFYWYEFVYNGRRVQESTKQGDRQTAKSLMAEARSRRARIDGGLESETAPTEKDRLTIGQLLDGLEASYKLDGKLTLRVRSNLNKARQAFSVAMRADQLTAADVDRYIEKRQRAGKTAATINRTVGLIAFAFKKAPLPGPKFRHLSEAGNERKGFFEADDFRRLLGHLPEDLHDFCEFAYLTSWRRGEVASLRWSDLEGDILRLRGENSKNGQSRSVVLTPQLAAIVQRRKQARLHAGVLTEFIFDPAGQLDADLRKFWRRACVAAGLGKFVCPKCHDEGSERTCRCGIRAKYVGRIFHDFRRSGVRNMVRSGVPQSIAMKISGHRTASIFRRYDITDEADLRDTMLKVETYNKTQSLKVVSIG